jgi:hypothetical protein
MTDNAVGNSEVLMDNKIFAELLQSANEPLEHAKGKREFRTTELPWTVVRGRKVSNS